MSLRFAIYQLNRASQELAFPVKVARRGDYSSLGAQRIYKNHSFMNTNL
jgi:hypothetical protein